MVQEIKKIVILLPFPDDIVKYHEIHSGNIRNQMGFADRDDIELLLQNNTDGLSIDENIFILMLQLTPASRRLHPSLDTFEKEHEMDDNVMKIISTTWKDIGQDTRNKWPELFQ